MNRIYTLVLLLLLSCSPGTGRMMNEVDIATAGVGSTDIQPAPAEPVDIDALMASMTVREKLAQLIHVWAFGTFQTDHDARYQRISRLVQEEKIGGFIFSRGDIYAQAVLTNKLQALSDIPLWISQDMEFGAAMRIEATTWMPPAMAMAAGGDPALDYTKGWITAMEAKAIGVHQVFAPVMDVNNNPRNPVINTRSYSEDPATVTRFGVEFLKGVQATGLVATIKHFPGHGDTDVDSHIGLPVINHDRARLDSVELVPFRAAIAAGVGSVMSAHIVFPKIGSEPGLPGTLDPNILTKLLREDLGFTGLVTTDALEMEGVSEHFSPGEALIRALMAGADMLLLPPDVSSALDGAVAAVESGRIPMSRLDESVRRMLDWKARLGLFDGDNQVDVNTLSSRIATPEYEAAADRMAEASMTLLKNEGGILPIRADRFRRILAVVVSDDRSGTAGQTFARDLRAMHPNVNFQLYDPRTSEVELDRIITAADNADLVIAATYMSVRTGSGSISMSPAQNRFLNRLEAKGKPTVLVALGNPYVVGDLPQAEVHLLGWASHNRQNTAAVNALFGAASITGRLPITLPNTPYARGAGITLPASRLRSATPAAAGLNADSLAGIGRIMNQAVRDGVFPGGTVTVVKDGRIAFSQGFGYFDYEKTRPVRTTDIYDLASISKVMGTTLAVMKLVDEGKLRLEDPISTWIPEYATGEKAKITVWHFLTHTSGLPPFRVYVDQIRTREALFQAVRNEPLTGTPGEAYVYSDLGLILLGQIIETITGKRQDQYLEDTFYGPMGLRSTMYNPLQRDPRLLDRIPPTENDTIHRKAWVRGVVHDERAYYLDGVAGHAGLFSNGGDLAVLAQLFLNKGTYGGTRYLSEAVVDRFTARGTQPGRRGIGFDMKSLTGFTTAGRLASDATYGHTGFTGTSIWIDPEQNITVIVLTNRTYPFRANATAVSRVRAGVAETVYRSLP